MITLSPCWEKDMLAPTGGFSFCPIGALACRGLDDLVTSRPKPVSSRVSSCAIV
ncbi:MAG TPA: hypothetical protein VFI29_13620 [Hanamia sp.]|nr:hypothetical protein [Hanamia sp.]